MIRLLFDNVSERRRVHTELQNLARQVKPLDLYSVQKSLFYLENGEKNNPNRDYGFGYVKRERKNSVCVRFRNKKALINHIEQIESIDEDDEWIKNLLELNTTKKIRESIESLD